MKQTFYIWPIHLDEFLGVVRRRKKRWSSLMLTKTKDHPAKVAVTVSWPKKSKEPSA